MELYCCSWNPLNLLFNLDLKAAVKNLYKPQQVLHKAAKQMHVITLKQMPSLSYICSSSLPRGLNEL